MLFLLLLVCTDPLLNSVEPSSPYLAFSVTDEGTYPLPKDIKDILENHPQNFTDFEWSPYLGPKINISVLPISDETQKEPVEITDPKTGAVTAVVDKSSDVPINAIETQLIDGLVNTGRFKILERQLLDKLQGEIDLGNSGETESESAPMGQHFIGARYLIAPIMTYYEPNASGKSLKLGFRGAGLSVGKNQSLVGMVFRLIDAQTSEILFSHETNVIISKRQFGGGGSSWTRRGRAGGGVQSYDKTPINEATKAAINFGIFEMVKQIKPPPLEGIVISIEGDEIVSNLGSQAVKQDKELDAFSLGKEYINPRTGKSMGHRKKHLGKVRVVALERQFSILEATDFDASSLSIGDLLKSEAKTVPMHFASIWEGPTNSKLFKKASKQKKERRKARRERRKRERQQSKANQQQGPQIL